MIRNAFEVSPTGETNWTTALDTRFIVVFLCKIQDKYTILQNIEHVNYSF